MKQIDILFCFLLFFILMIGAHVKAGPCPKVSIDTKSATNSVTKFGLWEISPYISTPPKIYLQAKVYNTASVNWNWYGPYSSYEMHGNYNATYSITYNYLNGTTTQIFTGNSSYTDGYGSHSGTVTNQATGQWSDGTQSATFVNNQVGSWNTYGFDGGCIGTSPTLTNEASSTFAISDWSGSSSTSSDCNGNPDYESMNSVQTTVLSTELTDSMLVGQMVSQMPAYPTNWATNQNSSAYYHLTSDHRTASGGNMEYRFHITDCTSDPHVSYLVRWTQVTTYDNTNDPPSIAHLKETIPGSADMVNGVYGSEHVVSLPSAPCTIVENYQNPPQIISGGNPGN